VTKEPKFTVATNIALTRLGEAGKGYRTDRGRCWWRVLSEAQRQCLTIVIASVPALNRPSIQNEGRRNEQASQKAHDASDKANSSPNFTLMTFVLLKPVSRFVRGKPAP